VLVHCHEGKSRSVALLLAYLMISKGHTLATALAHIRCKGSRRVLMACCCTICV
jgi:protein-tyrosine phosphatase